MGMFTQRPEDPTEWAGLPSEPDRPESAAERLANASNADAFGLIGDAAVESIVIPVAPVIEVAQVSVESGQGDDPDYATR